MRTQVDTAFETCKQRIQEYEKRLPDEFRKKSIFDEASGALPNVSSHYATQFSDKKASAKEQEQPKIKGKLSDANHQPYCRIM